MDTIHQLKVTLRGIHPPIWRRVHVPSTATLAELHEVIQVAMGWEQHHLHVFGRGDLEYGDNARDETSVTLASLIGRIRDWLGYRYDFGDCWDHDIEVEKVYRAAKKATYPYRVAKSVLGTSRWDPAKWDRAEVNAGLAGLAKLWGKQEAKETAEKAVAIAPAKASPAPSPPDNGRPENGRFAGR